MGATLFACATVPPTTFSDASFSTPGPDRHITTIERGSNVGSNHAPLSVYVDGSLVAKLYGNQAINLFLPNGRHRIGVAMNNVGVFGHDEHGPDRSITIDLPGSDSPILRAAAVGGVLPVWGIERVN